MKTKITDTFCYAGYSWRVFSNNRFAGYVTAMSEFDAMRKAQDKFGKNIWIERIVDPEYNK
jgi:hypothetical protein